MHLPRITAPVPLTVLAATAALCALAAPQSARAGDDGTASYVIDAEVKLTTDQRTRGVSDSFNQPALKLGVTAAHESGLLALAEIATVSKKQFLGGEGYGLTLAGGYRWGNPDGWHFGVGVARELFPGAKFEAPHGFDFGFFTPTDFRVSDWNTTFAVVEVGWGAIEGRVMNVVSDTYRGINTGGVCGTMLNYALTAGTDPTDALNCYARGDHGSRGSWLFDIDYKVDIAAATVLNLHLGHQTIRNFSEANFTDWRIGVTHKRWGFDWSVDYYGTATKVRELYLATDGDKLESTDNDKIVVSVSRRF